MEQMAQICWWLLSLLELSCHKRCHFLQFCEFFSWFWWSLFPNLQIFNDMFQQGAKNIEGSHFLKSHFIYGVYSKLAKCFSGSPLWLQHKTKKWNTGFQQNQVISIYHIKCAQNFHKLYMAQLMEQQGSCRAWLIDKSYIGPNVHPTISYLKYSVRTAWVFSQRGWKIYECPKWSSHPQLLSVKQLVHIYVLGPGVSLQWLLSPKLIFILWINVPSRTSIIRVFFQIFMYIHWSGSPTLISIKWWLP
jgi:hypothetical protein